MIQEQDTLALLEKLSPQAFVTVLEGYPSDRARADAILAIPEFHAKANMIFKLIGRNWGQEKLLAIVNTLETEVLQKRFVYLLPSSVGSFLSVRMAPAFVPPTPTGFGAMVEGVVATVTGGAVVGGLVGAGALETLQERIDVLRNGTTLHYPLFDTAALFHAFETKIAKQEGPFIEYLGKDDNDQIISIRTMHAGKRLEVLRVGVTRTNRSVSIRISSTSTKGMASEVGGIVNVLLDVAEDIQDGGSFDAQRHVENGLDETDEAASIWAESGMGQQVAALVDTFGAKATKDRPQRLLKYIEAVQINSTCPHCTTGRVKEATICHQCRQQYPDLIDTSNFELEFGPNPSDPLNYV